LLVSGRRAPQLPIIGPLVHQLEGEAFIEALRRIGGTPEVVLQDKELMKCLTPVLRADFSITEKYDYEPDAPLVLPINAFGGVDDQRIGHDGMSAWRVQTTGPFSLDMLPGGHFFLNTARELFFGLVAERLAA
jgi:surfactin synthase thioesterase subunit